MDDCDELIQDTELINYSVLRVIEGCALPSYTFPTSPRTVHQNLPTVSGRATAASAPSVDLEDSVSAMVDVLAAQATTAIRNADVALEDSFAILKIAAYQLRDVLADLFVLDQNLSETSASIISMQSELDVLFAGEKQLSRAWRSHQHLFHEHAAIFKAHRSRLEVNIGTCQAEHDDMQRIRQMIVAARHRKEVTLESAERTHAAKLEMVGRIRQFIAEARRAYATAFNSRLAWPHYEAREPRNKINSLEYIRAEYDTLTAMFHGGLGQHEERL